MRTCERARFARCEHGPVKSAASAPSCPRPGMRPRAWRRFRPFQGRAHARTRQERGLATGAGLRVSSTGRHHRPHRLVNARAPAPRLRLRPVSHASTHVARTAVASRTRLQCGFAALCTPFYPLVLSCLKMFGGGDGAGLRQPHERGAGPYSRPSSSFLASSGRYGQRVTPRIPLGMDRA